ncbi:MAG: methyl-accepting chemotaxis protein [Alphaproteobacteria bacterium]|nr:methyl-accepting chemotaxis protein [Alphaproteobacteria bacterium]
MNFSFLRGESSSERQRLAAPLTREELFPDSISRTEALKIIHLVCQGKFEQARDFAKSLSFQEAIEEIEFMKSARQSDLERAVDLSIHVNESSNYGAKLNRISLDINHRSQSMAAALEELSSSSNTIVGTIQNVNECSDSMQSNVQMGISASQDLGQANDDIEHVVSNTEAKVLDLVSSTEEIHRILKIISEISEKTKLLSLNATIEAARAGEAGKGFAVVASEVKSLAEQTSTSAEDIKNKVQSLTNVTRDISRLMGDVAQAVTTGRAKLQASQNAISCIQENSEQVSEQMQEIMSIIRDQDQAVSDITTNVGEIATQTSESVDLVKFTLDAMDLAEVSLVDTLSSFPQYELDHTTVNLAKSDHVIWKKRLSSMAAGRTQIDPKNLTDHKNCRLGKWYYSEASVAYHNIPAFREIEAAHINVHKHGILAAQKYSQSDLESALKEIDLVEEASKQVLSYLDEMKK